MAQVWTQSCHSDIDWKEVNPEFGYHDDVPHERDDEKKNDDDNDNDQYRHMVFEFEELEDNTPITLRTKKEISQSTGLAIWTCSQILSGYLLDHPYHVREQRVLELGAGLGLCGIIAHRLGATHVLATDGDVDVLQNLRHNTQCNANVDSDTNISCPQLVWGHNLSEFQRTHEQQSVIIATDVIYSPKAVEPLWKTVDALLEPDGKFLLAFCTRSVPVEDVLDEARYRGFTWSCPDITASTDEDVENESKQQYGDESETFDDATPDDSYFGYHVFHFKRRLEQS